MSTYDDEDPLVPVEQSSSSKMVSTLCRLATGALVLTAIVSSIIHAFSSTTAWLPVGVGFLAVALATGYLLKMAAAGVFDEKEIVYSIYTQSIGSIILAGSFMALIFQPGAGSVFYVGGSVSGNGMGVIPSGSASVVITLGDKQQQTIPISTSTQQPSSAKAFLFPTPLAEGTSWSATVTTKPPAYGTNGANCKSLSSGGTVSSDVTQNLALQVNCDFGFSIGGSISGLPVGQTIQLKGLYNNGAIQDTTTITSTSAANLQFAMSQVATPTAGQQGVLYTVTVLSPPSGCTVTGGQGTASAAVTGIQIQCTAVPTPPTPPTPPPTGPSY